MAKAYKCDLCGKLVEDCYGVAGLDIYPNELRKMGIKKDRKHEVVDVCEDCHNSIKSVVNEIFEKKHNVTTEE